MRIITGFGRFWWDFIVGEDWRIAAGVVITLAVGAVLVAATDLPDSIISVISGGGIVTVAIGSIIAPARSKGMTD